jgi:hypothetical protein
MSSLYDWGWIPLRIRAKELRRTRTRAADRYKARMKAEHGVTVVAKKKK